ncbi:MAG: ArnT family glycosyltransferase [Terriglobales bacterium]
MHSDYVILARYLPLQLQTSEIYWRPVIVALETRSRPQSLRLLRIVLVALALRLVVMYFLYPEHLNPERDHWYFGGETGHIARSLVEGKGLSSPMFAETGPTAWQTPIYPCLLALVFRVFGVFSKGSAICILSLNSLFSALTCLPVFFMARRSFGEKTAWRAGWAWALFPYAIFFSASHIWPTTLTTLLLPLAFLAGLQLEDSTQLGTWIKFGLLGGVAAMNDPVVLTVLPALGLWMCYRTWQRRDHWLRPALGAALAFMVVVLPWFIRNYRAFHKIVPFRGNFGVELYIGNNGDTSHFTARYLHPEHNDAEWQEYVRLGEARYMEHKQQQAVAFISSHKGLFLRTSLRRVIYLWTNYWSLSRDYLQQEPYDIPAIFFNVTLSALALWGLWTGWRTFGAAVVPYAIALFCFPLVYYVTHEEDFYRRPADPFFVILAVYAVSAWLEHRHRKTQTAVASD